MTSPTPAASALNYYGKMATSDLTNRIGAYYYQERIHGGMTGSQRSCARAISAVLTSRIPSDGLGYVENWDERAALRDGARYCKRIAPYL